MSPIVPSPRAPRSADTSALVPPGRGRPGRGYAPGRRPRRKRGEHVWRGAPGARGDRPVPGARGRRGPRGGLGAVVRGRARLGDRPGPPAGVADRRPVRRAGPARRGGSRGAAPFRTYRSRGGGAGADAAARGGRERGGTARTAGLAGVGRYRAGSRGHRDRWQDHRTGTAPVVAPLPAGGRALAAAPRAAAGSGFLSGPRGFREQGWDAPDLVRLVDMAATECHRVRLRRSRVRPTAGRPSSQPLAAS